LIELGIGTTIFNTVESVKHCHTVETVEINVHISTKFQ
jgi:hypothetical protein